MGEAVDASRLDELRELLSEGDGAFGRFLNEYLSSAERGLLEIRAAAAASDAAALERRAHALKGASGNVGANRLAEACRRLEEAARRGRTADDDWPSVEAEFARVRRALEPLARAARA